MVPAASACTAPVRVKSVKVSRPRAKRTAPSDSPPGMPLRRVAMYFASSGPTLLRATAIRRPWPWMQKARSAPETKTEGAFASPGPRAVSNSLSAAGPVVIRKKPTSLPGSGLRTQSSVRSRPIAPTLASLVLRILFADACA